MAFGSLTSPQYLVDKILKTHEVHLINGASGSGKTTWGLQFLDSWHQGLPILGYDSHPRPFCYVSCDRSEESIELTMLRLGLDLKAIPYLDCRHLIGSSDAFEAVTLASRKLVPKVHLLFIEGFVNMAPRTRSTDLFSNTSKFLAGLAATLLREDMTVIGTVHSPKQRQGAEYLDPRQRISGSGAWSAFTDTVIEIRRTSLKDVTDPRREVILLARQVPDQLFEYQIDSKGRFIPASIPIAADVTLEGFVNSLPQETDIEVSVFMEFASKHHINQRTVYRWLREAVEDGVLVRVGHGLYIRTRVKDSA